MVNVNSDFRLFRVSALRREGGRRGTSRAIVKHNVTQHRIQSPTLGPTWSNRREAISLGAHPNPQGNRPGRLSEAANGASVRILTSECAPRVYPRR